MTEERKVDWGAPSALGVSVRSCSGHDWDENWKECVIIEIADADRLYVKVMRADGKIGLLRTDQIECIPAQPILPDDLTARMVALVKRVAVEPRNLIEEHAEARAIVAELQPVDEHEAYADALLKQQGWHGEPSIGFAAVARMIATAHEDGRALERGEGK